MMRTFNLLIFLFMNIFVSFQLSDDDKNNFVFSGKCVKQSANFCNELVENSACNNLKDECFCRKGYVAIREGTRISCKTLLTDLACRMDRDCVHVTESMCHPGAGQCVCPGQHIYVEAINACRRKFEDTSNFSCQSCKANNGQCFEYTRQDMKSYALKSKNNVGCSCSSHRTTTDSNDGLCNTHMVDIGEFCNNRDLICRSKKAICSRISNQDSISTCTCVTGYVPVYQKTLKYYECFPIISETAFFKCSKCFQSGGYCYDLNGDQEGDGCSCPGRFSNEVDGPLSLLKPCSINHVGVTCNNDLMSICYIAHNRPPYKSLAQQLKNGRAVAIIKSPKYSNKVSSARQRLVISTGTKNDRPENNHLKMKSTNSGENENKFCTKIDLADERFIEAYQLKNDKVRYSTLVHVIVDSLKSTPGRDMIFPINCNGKPLKKMTVKTFNQIEPDTGDMHFLSVDLRIINPLSHSEINSASYGDLIKLDVSLVDSKGVYREIEVLQCWTVDKKTNSLRSPLNNTGKILYSKCQEKNIMYNHHSIAWIHASPGIHYQSSEFTPELYSNVSSVEYHCLILLCRHKSLCTDQNYCSLINKYSINQKENDQFVIVERQSLLSFNTKVVIDMVTHYTDLSIKECKYSLCLTQSQAIMTTLLMLLLLILVVVLVIILYRRQKAIQTATIKQKRNINDMSQHQINTLCKRPYSQKIYLLSDTGSLSTSLDKFESEPCSMYSHLFITSDTYKSTMSNFQDNFPNSFGQQISGSEMYSGNIINNNTIRKSVHLNNHPDIFNNDIKPNESTHDLDSTRMQMDSYVNFSGDTNKIKSKSLIDKLNMIDNAPNNEARNSTSNTSNKDAYV